MRNGTLAQTVGLLGMVTGLSLGVSGCEKTGNPGTYSGYIEARTLAIAAPQSGWITEIMVDRGQDIRPGQVVFRLEDTQAKAQLKSVEGRLEAATSTAEDVAKGGRPVDLAPLFQQKRDAEAALNLARLTETRYQKLSSSGFVSQEKLDQLRTQTQRAEASLATIDRQIAQRQTAARSDQIAAARAQADATKSDVAAAQWVLDDRSVRARLTARVDDRLREPGEFVTAGAPVVTLISDDRTFVRFFVPQADLSKFQVGKSLKVTCDGCKPQTAKVRFIAHEAEFTPPVIYSLKERQKLVFLVEATLERPRDVHVGQPVDVAL